MARWQRMLSKFELGLDGGDQQSAHAFVFLLQWLTFKAVAATEIPNH